MKKGYDTHTKPTGTCFYNKKHLAHFQMLKAQVLAEMYCTGRMQTGWKRLTAVRESRDGAKRKKGGINNKNKTIDLITIWC